MCYKLHFMFTAQGCKALLKANVPAYLTSVLYNKYSYPFLAVLFPEKTLQYRQSPTWKQVMFWKFSCQELKINFTQRAPKGWVLSASVKDLRDLFRGICMYSDCHGNHSRPLSPRVKLYAINNFYCFFGTFLNNKIQKWGQSFMLEHISSTCTIPQHCVHTKVMNCKGTRGKDSFVGGTWYHTLGYSELPVEFSTTILGNVNTIVLELL